MLMRVHISINHKEDYTMKKTLILLTTSLLLLISTACSSINTQTEAANSIPNITTSEVPEVTIVYLSFEQALLSSTDIVSVRYIGQRPFGEHLTEFEFAVIDRILGNAADTIFIYATNAYASVLDGGGTTSYNQSGVTFNSGTNYLLALRRLEGATLRTHEDGYLFIHNLIINLNNPSLSSMYNEPLSYHLSIVDFASASFYRADSMIAFISNLTAENALAREHIRSTNMNDIITESPYVLIVEINEPRRLVAEQATRDWMETDIFFATVVESLKGNIEAGYQIEVVFFADTVRTGERHVIAAERLTEGSSTFVFTSRNSLFSMSQIEQITEITAQ